MEQVVSQSFTLCLEHVGMVSDMAARYVPRGKRAPVVRAAIEHLYSQPDEVIAAAIERTNCKHPEPEQAQE